MENLFGIVAPIATTIAAVMTAANLGPRLTGWGFVVFAFGSLAWCVVGFATGQHNLLMTNAFLVLVNLVGSWRWLGRVALHEDGARAAESKSENASAPSLVAVSSLVDCMVTDRSGAAIGKIVGIMAESERGNIAFVVVGVGGVGGIGERLVAMKWPNLVIIGDDIRTSLSEREIDNLPDVNPNNWPITVN